MVESGYLTASEAEIVENESLRFRTNLFDIRAPHFVMYVQDKAAQLVGRDEIRKGGLRIFTTLDVDLQIRCLDIGSSTPGLAELSVARPLYI